MSARNEMHENIIIGINLSLVGGFLDAYTYLLKGGVFANAQTGNFVLLSISIISGDSGKLLKYFIPILMFLIGVFISEIFKSSKTISKSNNRVKLILGIECLVIICIGFFGSKASNALINSVVSFLAAVQVVTFDRLNGNPVATTMITGNLKNTMTNLSAFIISKNKRNLNKALIYITVIFAFGMGAFAGSLICRAMNNYAILVCLLPLLTSFVLIEAGERRR